MRCPVTKCITMSLKLITSIKFCINSHPIAKKIYKFFDNLINCELPV